MTIIEIWPYKFSNQNFIRQGLPAKRQMVPFRLISLNLLIASALLTIWSKRICPESCFLFLQK
jgi:hypothetical protein